MLDLRQCLRKILDQILRILAFSIENPLHFDRKKFEQLLLKEGELADSVVDKGLKK